MRDFDDLKDGEILSYDENLLYATIMILTMGWGLKSYRTPIANEMFWNTLKCLGLVLLTQCLFFIPLLITFPISIPAIALLMRKLQEKDAKKVVINALKGR